jgi:hypothetical protein
MTGMKPTLTSQRLPRHVYELIHTQVRGLVQQRLSILVYRQVSQQVPWQVRGQVYTPIQANI